MRLISQQWMIGVIILGGGLSLPLLSHGDWLAAVKHPQQAWHTFHNGTAVGNLSGKFTVNPQGSAVYDIALATPPGTAKMVPSLSLHYDSSQGNGMLGMGFDLQGLTAITRANQNYVQNGQIHGVDFTNNDCFTLNGHQ